MAVLYGRAGHLTAKKRLFRPGQLLMICACVLGGMVMGGWELGNIESICLTILAGFCVDYVVHIRAP